MIRVHLQDEVSSRELSVPAGTTVQAALERAGVQLSELDRANPPGYTVLTDGTEITITRIHEQFEIEEITLPFQRQTVRNEGLQQGETRLLQPGTNGVEEITYRILFENGVEVSRQPVKRTILRQAQAEIVMVGSQSTHRPIEIAGKMAFLSGGNAWVMEGDSGTRQPLVVTGDLDGRVFALSPGGDWLLYSRISEEQDIINTLWVVQTDQSEAEPINLNVSNVIHFADWSPTRPSFTIAFSTVEPRPSAPGWQANNDLQTVTFSSSGNVIRKRELIPANAGGQYGWWGTSFAWAHDGLHLAYARADGVGVIDLRDPAYEALFDIVPFQTRGDWAWLPGMAWGHDNRTLYIVNHAEPVGLEGAAASPAFDVTALASSGALILPLAKQAGMFAYPSISPYDVLPSGEISYQIAFMQAIAPLESQFSSYRVALMDRDGSNLQTLFPGVGEPGIAVDEIGPIEWSPAGDRIALIYRGDLWVVDVDTGLGQQLTGDGLTSATDWAS
jgi:hypothetical protein